MLATFLGPTFGNASWIVNDNNVRELFINVADLGLPLDTWDPADYLQERPLGDLTRRKRRLNGRCLMPMRVLPQLLEDKIKSAQEVFERAEANTGPFAKEVATLFQNSAGVFRSALEKLEKRYKLKRSEINTPAASS